MLRVEDDIGKIANPELQAIVLLQWLTLDFLAIDKRSVLAALVYHAELPIFRNDHGVVARNPRVRNDQILVDFSAHAEGTVVKLDDSLLISLHIDQGGK